MRPIATGDPVAWCVSLSVTRLRCVKRLNGSKSCSGWRLVGMQGILEGPDPPYGEVGSMRSLPDYFGLLFYFACVFRWGRVNLPENSLFFENVRILVENLQLQLQASL